MTLLVKSVSPAVAGASLIIGAGALFALANTLVQRLVMIEGVPAGRVAFWQYALASALVLPWVFWKGASALRTATPSLHFLRIVLAAGGVQLWVLGLVYVPIWQAIALIMLSPFFVTFGTWLILRERVGPRRWSAVTTGFLGGMIILAPWTDALRIQALLPVAAAALWAGSSLLTKSMTKTESAETLTVYLLLLLTPINAGLALGDGISLSIGGDGVLLLAVGFATALAQYALASSYRIADASFLQSFDHVKLPLNVGLGWAVFGFVPPGTMWLGALIIVGSSLYLVWAEQRQSPTVLART